MLFFVTLSLVLCLGEAQVPSEGKCYSGSSNSIANDYPPKIMDCGIRSTEGGEETGLVCFLGKVADLNFYSMLCMSAIQCEREKNQVTAGTNILYEEVVCCNQNDLCNNYEDPIPDDDDTTGNDSGSNKNTFDFWVITMSMIFVYISLEH